MSLFTRIYIEVMCNATWCDRKEWYILSSNITLGSYMAVIIIYVYSLYSWSCLFIYYTGSPNLLKWHIFCCTSLIYHATWIWLNILRIIIAVYGSRNILIFIEIMKLFIDIIHWLLGVVKITNILMYHPYYLVIHHISYC